MRFSLYIICWEPFCTGHDLAVRGMEEAAELIPAEAECRSRMEELEYQEGGAWYCDGIRKTAGQDTESKEEEIYEKKDRKGSGSGGYSSVHVLVCRLYGV